MVFCILIFLSSGVFASLGVSPRSYEVDFKPGLIQNFSFDFVLNDTLSNLYVKGNLAKYVSLNKERISGHEKVVALLSLPLEIAIPGTNQIDIVAGGVVAAIKVNVPYPKKFVGLELSAPNVNVGEDVDINLRIVNLGTEAADVNYTIEVYKGAKKINTIRGAKIEFLNISKVLNHTILLDTSNYSAGDYNAVASVSYDGNITKTENSFKLGELSVKILNYSKVFRENKVNKFEINVESLWNVDIKSLYVEVRVGDKGFDTPIVGLDAWGEKTLVGFFDTKNVPGYDILANITLHYNNKSSSEVVKLKILKGIDYIFYVVVFISLIVVIVLVWRFLIFIKKLKNI